MVKSARKLQRQSIGAEMAIEVAALLRAIACIEKLTVVAPHEQVGAEMLTSTSRQSQSTTRG